MAGTAGTATTRSDLPMKLRRRRIPLATGPRARKACGRVGALHALRSSALLARLALLWFLLALGVAAASPAVQPQVMELVCTAAGGMLVVTGEDGPAPLGQSALDCSLCLTPLGTAAPAIATLPLPQPLAHALTPMAAAHIAALVGAPLPPRGPPSQG